MNIIEYQKAALTTAIYPEKWRILYPATGLCEETGEVAGKFKRVIRDSNEVLTEETKKAIVLELGDCMWYLAVLAHDADVMLPVSYKPIASTSTSFNDTLNDVVKLNGYAALISKALMTDTPSFTTADRFLICFNLIYKIAAFVGYTFEDVMGMNIEKLQNRVKNNTLHGSGDNR